MTVAAATRITVDLPTPYGRFDAHAFERPSGHVYVALVYGDVDGADDVLVRVHSECLTGDALGSLRCDCGVQLREALRTIVANGQGVLVYATGHEGRGIGLMNKLRAYVAQQHGADTVDANHLLGLPADARDYGDAAFVIASLGINSIRLLTNNPAKARGLEVHGITVTETVGLHTTPHRRNAGYLATKSERMGHVLTNGHTSNGMTNGGATDGTNGNGTNGNGANGAGTNGTNGHTSNGHRQAAVVGDDTAPVIPVVDPALLVGTVAPSATRPAVVVKLAQSLDGRIATSTGDSQWISGDAERAVSHGLRATCDAVLVGAETVIQDDPRLTVRAVAGASPIRVVLDSRLRTPADAQLYTDDGATIVMTTAASDEADREERRRAGVGVEVVDHDADGRVDVHAALARLHELGMSVVLVEGGASLVTALLRERLVDRLIVSTAPLLLGSGLDAVGDLGIGRVADALRLEHVVVAQAGDDVLMAGDVVDPATTTG